MNFAMNNIKIKSNWFDHEKNSRNQINNKYLKMGGYKSFFVYITLFRFRIYKQEDDYTFITSIALLRKETGYSTQDIFEYIKMMKKLKIIDIKSHSRWDYLLDMKGNIKDKELLIIVATDTPNTKVVEAGKDEKGNVITKDEPVTADDYYISLSLELFQYYIDLKLNERYFPMYCLLKKLRNGSSEKKSWMKVEKMADVLGYDKDFTHKLIIEMNRHYLLYSRKRTNAKGQYYFEHYLSISISNVDLMKKNFQEECDKYVAKMDKRAALKRKSRMSKDEEIEIDHPEENKEVSLAFGAKSKSENNQVHKQQNKSSSSIENEEYFDDSGNIDIGLMLMNEMDEQRKKKDRSKKEHWGEVNNF